MSDRIQAEIVAVDNASPKFKQVATAAGQMDQALDKSSASAAKFSKAGAAVGAAIGSLVGILGDAARANAEAEVSQARLVAAVESTGEIYETYADQLERAGEAAVQMGFDDEAAADSIAALTIATNDSQEAINQQALVMDIARGRGIDLAAATKLVIAAEQERFGALARVGIKLDENATKEEALAALQAKYAGQAEAYANTQMGFMDELAQKYENGMELIGGYAGGIQTLLMLLPGLSAGFTAAAAAAGGLNTMLGLGGAAGAARGLAALLGGPLGLALLFTGTALAMQQTRDDGYSVADAYRDAADGAEQLDAVQKQLSETNAQEFYDTNRGEAAVETIKAMIGTVHDLNVAVDEGKESQLGLTTDEALGQIYDYNQSLGGTYNSLTKMATVESAIAEIYASAGPGRKDAIQDYLELVNGWETGALSAAQFSQGVVTVAENLDMYNIRALEARDATEDVATGFDKAGLQAQALVNDVGDAAGAVVSILAQVEAAQAAFEAQFNLTTGAYRGTTEALEAGFRTAVGNTNAIAQQSQAVADWATNLIDAQGAYSELDKLVAEGRITGESGQFEGPSEYAAAQRAYNSILEDNAEIQRDILSIQAQQAPTIAAMVAEQEKYISGLADGTQAEQMRALAYMDSATSAQALQLAQGYLENQDVFGPMITQAAALNPYLALILEDMGLISRDHEGNITLTGAENAKSELDLLTEAIQALVQAQWIATFDGDVSRAEAAYEHATGLSVDWDNNESESTLTADDSQAQATFNDVFSRANLWGNTSESATVGVNDNASVTLQNIAGLLGQLQDKTITVTTINNAINPFGWDGGVMQYANGGVTAGMGETGDEILRYPNGNVGRTNGPGMYNVPSGTYVTPAPASADLLGGGLHIHVSVGGNVLGITDLTREVAAVLAPAIIDVLDDMELGAPR